MSNAWEKLDPSGTAAPARARSDASVWKNEILVFGGQGSSSSLADLWGFDISKFFR